MTGTDGRLAGLFLLGGKKSEVPYTANDRALLEALAYQIAIVHENVRLKEHVKRDRKIKHEMLARLEGNHIDLLKECPACGACFDGPARHCTRDDSELTLSLPVERVIEGRYRLDRLEGRGGMGAVFRAMDLRLGREVAVKILSGSMFGDRAALRRFKREAQTLARLNHPNVVAIHDYGELNTEGAFLVMDLVEGESLRAVLEREERLPPPVVAAWIEQVLEGIAAAHQEGIIHRDLKPENVLIAKRPRGQDQIKILDFGLAKFARRDVSDLTSVTTPGTMIGTFGYMSPEQLTGEEVDERCDLFSVGVMAFEALTGSRPFQGRTVAGLTHSMQRASFGLGDSSPEARRLDDVLRKCLAVSAAVRFSTARAMQQELIAAMRDCHTIVSNRLREHHPNG